MIFSTKPTDNQLVISTLCFMNVSFTRSDGQPAASQSWLKSDNISKDKKSHLHLAFCDAEASRKTTWPLKTGQIVPPCKSSDVCVFFGRLCEPLSTFCFKRNLFDSFKMAEMIHSCLNLRNYTVLNEKRQIGTKNSPFEDNEPLDWCFNNDML